MNVRYTRSRGASMLSAMHARLLVALVLVAVSTNAYADRIAIEAYVQARPAEAQPIMTTLWRVLAKHGFADTSRLTKLFANHAWQFGGSKSVAAVIAKKSADGVNKFLDAKLAAADQDLTQALALARANPIAWVGEPNYRDEVMRAMLYHALALGKQADSALASSTNEKSKTVRQKLVQQADALGQARDAAMADLIRTFPSVVITSKEHGLDAETLFQRVRKELNAAGRGSLEIKLSSPGAQVYIGERVPDPRKPIGDMQIGVHKVVIVELGQAKQYDVEIFANKTSRLYVNSELDSMVVLDGWIGLRYPSSKEQAREPQLVAELVGKETDSVIALVFTIERAGKSTTVKGRTYDVRNVTLKKSCQAELARYDDESKLQELVKCLMDLKVQSDTKEQQPEPPKGPITASADREEPSSAASVSGANETTDDESKDEAPAAVNPRGWMLWAGVGGIAAGLLGGGLAIKFGLDAQHAGEELRRVCMVSCTGDEAKALETAQSNGNRNAIISGVAGGVATVAGGVFLTLWYLGRGQGQPTVQASAHAVTFGWALSF